MSRCRKENKDLPIKHVPGLEASGDQLIDVGLPVALKGRLVCSSMFVLAMAASLLGMVLSMTMSLVSLVILRVNWHPEQDVKQQCNSGELEEAEAHLSLAVRGCSRNLVLSDLSVGGCGDGRFGLLDRCGQKRVFLLAHALRRDGGAAENKELGKAGFLFGNVVWYG